MLNAIANITNISNMISYHAICHIMVVSSFLEIFQTSQNLLPSWPSFAAKGHCWLQAVPPALDDVCYRGLEQKPLALGRHTTLVATRNPAITQQLRERLVVEICHYLQRLFSWQHPKRWLGQRKFLNHQSCGNRMVWIVDIQICHTFIHVVVVNLSSYPLTTLLGACFAEIGLG